MRRIQLVSTLLAVAALLPAASPAAPQAPATVQVHFLQGEQLVARARPGSTVRAAVAALLAGAERSRAPGGRADVCPRAHAAAGGLVHRRRGDGRPRRALRLRPRRRGARREDRAARLHGDVRAGGEVGAGARGGWRAARPLPRLRALPAGDARAGDAAVLDAPILAAERAAAPYRYGPLAGLIRTGERYGVVLPKGSALTTRIDAAVRALVANGTLTRLQRRWLTADLGRLRVLR